MNNVFAQIGLVMLIGLAAKNAILIVEFTPRIYEKGRPLIEAALIGARTRLRPILMTSFAYPSRVPGSRPNRTSCGGLLERWLLEECWQPSSSQPASFRSLFMW